MPEKPFLGGIALLLEGDGDVPSGMFRLSEFRHGVDKRAAAKPADPATPAASAPAATSDQTTTEATPGAAKGAKPKKNAKKNKDDAKTTTPQ